MCFAWQKLARTQVLAFESWGRCLMSSTEWRGGPGGGGLRVELQSCFSSLILAFPSCRVKINLKCLMPLRALMTWKPRSPSLRPPALTSHHLHPWVTPTMKDRLPPMLPVDHLGKLGSQARPLLCWAESTGGSSQTPETFSLPLASSEGSSIRTSPPWGVSQLRTLRRPGKPRPAPRASPTSRWYVGGLLAGAGVPPAGLLA